MAEQGLSSLWMILAVLLTLMMVPGLGLFYAGFCRAKHSVNALFMCFFPLAPLLLIWLLFGFSLVFGESLGGIVGSVEYFGLVNLPADISGVPAHIFVLFQGIFSVLACVIISGAVVERMKQGFWVVFSCLWAILVYYPVAHWVWGDGGWIEALGAKDFAGGLVVHITSGASAFALAKSIGRRLDFFKLKQSYNLGLVFTGASLLWVGWFGFNAGSALAFDNAALTAVVSTLVAGVSVLVSWYALDLFFTPHRPSFKGLNMALICGLVAITPAAGFVGVWEAVSIGLISGVACNLGNRYFHSVIRVDDALDVFVSHGVSGFLGALLLGLFASSQVNSSIANGVLHGGDWSIFNANLVGSLAVGGYSMLVTKLLYILLSKVLPPRMESKEEEAGADLSIHGERVFILKNGQDY